MKGKTHAIAGAIAFLSILTFWITTVLTKLFYSTETIVWVKQWIVQPGLFILIPAIAITGGTGFSLSKSRKGRLVEDKKKRMPFIAFNGIVVLVPSAILLAQWANAGMFDLRFNVVQGIELVAGAINLILMGKNMGDGLRMTGRLRLALSKENQGNR